MTVPLQARTTLWAVVHLLDEFKRRGWHEEWSFVSDLVVEIQEGGGLLRKKHLAVVPRLFLTKNQTTRAEVNAVVQEVLGEVILQ